MVEGLPAPCATTNIQYARTTTLSWSRNSKAWLITTWCVAVAVAPSFSRRYSRDFITGSTYLLMASLPAYVRLRGHELRIVSQRGEISREVRGVQRAHVKPQRFLNGHAIASHRIQFRVLPVQPARWWVSQQAASPSVALGRQHYHQSHRDASCWQVDIGRISLGCSTIHIVLNECPAYGFS